MNSRFDGDHDQHAPSCPSQLRERPLFVLSRPEQCDTVHFGQCEGAIPLQQTKPCQPPFKQLHKQSYKQSQTTKNRNNPETLNPKP